jgi:hypothetical protein
MMRVWKLTPTNPVVASSASPASRRRRIPAGAAVAAVMSVRGCIALCREYGKGDLDAPAIIERLRRHYKGVNFELAMAKAHADLAERMAFVKGER